MNDDQYDEWLPIETKLVVGSIMTGLVLLGVMLWLTSTYFPIAPQ